MEGKDIIIGIYSYFDKGSWDGDLDASVIPAAYYLIHVFDEHGIIDSEYLHKVYFEIHGDPNLGLPSNYIGPFKDMVELNQYSFRVCDQRNASKINLFSVNDFNATLGEVSNVEELKELLARSGNSIENISKTGKKSGLLGKIFS